MSSVAARWRRSGKQTARSWCRRPGQAMHSSSRCAMHSCSGRSRCLPAHRCRLQPRSASGSGAAASSYSGRLRAKNHWRGSWPVGAGRCGRGRSCIGQMVRVVGKMHGTKSLGHGEGKQSSSDSAGGEGQGRRQGRRSGERLKLAKLRNATTAPSINHSRPCTGCGRRPASNRNVMPRAHARASFRLAMEHIVCSK